MRKSFSLAEYLAENEDCWLYYALWDVLHRYAGPNLFGEILMPLLEKRPPRTEWLTKMGTAVGEKWPHVSREDLWELYALSRINDLLLLPFQPNSGYGFTPDAALSLEQYLAFMKEFGCTVVEHGRFSPFFHEIIAVEQTENMPVAVTKTLWPSLMIGNLMLSRAGCHVSGGSDQIRKEVAECSTMYWTYARRNRPHEDLSHGWGSNSQWRTDFRRDFIINGQYHYNVDGKLDVKAPDNCVDPNPAREDLSVAERIELLTNRCFIFTEKESSERWPYYDYFSEPAT